MQGSSGAAGSETPDWGPQHSLRASYVERWVGVRLWVYEPRSERPAASVLYRSALGGRFADKLLARGVAAPAPPGQVVRSPLDTLVAGLVGLYGDAYVRRALDELAASAAPAPPPGDMGAVYPAHTKDALPSETVDPPA